MALAPMRARLKQVEAAIGKLNAEAATISDALANPKLYETGKADLIARATQRQAAIAREVAALEEEWLDLSEKLEAA
jgi:ATP-binding cassette subfamily F protein 3